MQGWISPEHIPLCARQETATQEQSLSKTRESQLVDKIKLLEEARSDLEAEVEQLEKQMKQLEILPRDPEQITKVHIRIASTCCLYVLHFPSVRDVSWRMAYLVREGRHRVLKWHHAPFNYIF